MEESTAESHDTGASTVPEKRKAAVQKGHEIKTITIRTPPHAYAHLSLFSSASKSRVPLDALTVRTHLTSALRQFLGTHGTAISIDILKIEEQDCWVRVPREDLSAFVAAVGGWVGRGNGDGEDGESVGWRVVAKSNWLGKLSWATGVEKIWKD